MSEEDDDSQLDLLEALKDPFEVSQMNRTTTEHGDGFVFPQISDGATVGNNVTFPQNQKQGLTTKRKSSTFQQSKPQKTARVAFFENLENDQEMSEMKKRFRQLKRRFQGPAGLLPVILSEEIPLINNSDHPLSQNISKLISSDLEVNQRPGRINDDLGQKSTTLPTLNAGLKSLQDDGDILKMSQAPWRELLRILGLDPIDPSELIKLMNIRWLYRKVSKHPVTTKIPFLALVVKEEPEIVRKKRTKLSEKKKTPSVKLMDHTGTILASIESSIVSMFGMELVPGAAIAIRNASFLRFKRQLILAITKENLICITYPKLENICIVRADKQKVTTDVMPEGNDVPSINNNCSISNVGIIDDTLPEIIDNPCGVRSIKFVEFSKEKAKEQYDTICAADIEIAVSRQNDDDRNFFQNVKRPSTLAGISRGILPCVDIGSDICNNIPTFVAATTIPSSSQATPELHSIFGDSVDDDNDELMQALDAADFFFRE